MKIQIESTTRTITVNGVECRVWEGQTAKGVPVQCVVCRIAAPVWEDLAEFEADLKEQAAPRQTQVFPLRMIL